VVDEVGILMFELNFIFNLSSSMKSVGFSGEMGVVVVVVVVMVDKF
jgi:hypothetical protein